MEKSIVVRGTLIAPRRRGECWLVKITCPHCGEVHLHGAGDDGTLLGSRVPHCRNRELWDRGQYDIIVSEEGQ